ncbi:MAG: hypothetical protein JO297_13225 [Nitrososphaeraceae archaeon]|nr:hypothetical protein [Nitrososphaeraceae archaeon]
MLCHILAYEHCVGYRNSIRTCDVNGKCIEQHGFNRQLWDNLGAKPLAVKGARPISLKTKARIRSDSKSIEQQGFICEFLGKLGC